ncbi:MAG TPA: triose-phosphate isomerase family protein [Patescibacteria group bacterium]|jgi:triosephosphate isomerase|nr:triose-phosphate isomerase family protein [Patescibacteria group bacterium]
MKKLIVANWKMNPQTTEDARRLFVTLEHRMHLINNAVDVTVCPPYVFMPLLSHFSHFLNLGSQNISAHEYGAYTGEISAEQLLLWKVSYVILGHSERRLYFGETDKDVQTKILLCLKQHLIPVVCLGGHPKADIKSMKPLVTKQFNSAVKNLDKSQIEKIAWAYEPTWAISSMQKSQPATGEHAAELIIHIRKLLAKHVGREEAEKARVLYGGTVNKGNVRDFARFSEISGALVGFASLEPTGFFEVIQEFAREAIHKT